MNDDSIATHMYCHMLSVLLTCQKKKKKKKKREPAGGLGIDSRWRISPAIGGHEGSRPADSLAARDKTQEQLEKTNKTKRGEGAPLTVRSGLLSFTFMHLADAFIQSDLHCIQVTVLHFISSCFPWESNP